MMSTLAVFELSTLVMLSDHVILHMKGFILCLRWGLLSKEHETLDTMMGRSLPRLPVSVIGSLVMPL